MKNGKKNVYIVDDVQENLQVIGNILKQNNINISVARNGEQALNGIKKKLPDLVLLDISMPGMDGYEVCKKLKEDAETAHIPVLFLTARTQTDDIVQGFKVGGVDYITKPFNSEELLSRVFTHLELKESRDLIESQNKELMNLNATKDKFFNIIAHDLRNPFNTILGFSNLLLHDLNNYPKERVYEIMLMISQSANATYKLLENLLEWGRSQSGSLSFNPVNINGKALIQENVQLLNESAASKKINLIQNADPDTVICADKDMINTVVRNLISNAIKFTPHEGQICIEAKQTIDATEISITDTGVGISDENIDKLFRIDKNHSTKGTNNEDGTGLGLVLCKEFIDRHDGKIWVESELGKGSRFSFLLPRQK